MTSSLKKPIIKLNDVHLSLGKGAARVHVLKGINLAIQKGKSVSLVGPSGSGKSTLLMVLSGLEKADRGKIHVANHDLTTLDEDGLARFRGHNIGIVFQSFHLLPNMTALENVAVPLELSGEGQAFQRAEEELKAVGLGERLHHYPSALSGGEQQRVAIARALIARPSLLIADEPTGNLDEKTGLEISNLLFSLQEKRDMTLLLVTHDRKLAEQCNETIEIKNGRILKNSTPEVSDRKNMTTLLSLSNEMSKGA